LPMTASIVKTMMKPKQGDTA